MTSEQILKTLRGDWTHMTAESRCNFLRDCLHDFIVRQTCPPTEPPVEPPVPVETVEMRANKAAAEMVYAYSDFSISFANRGSDIGRAIKLADNDGRDSSIRIIREVIAEALLTFLAAESGPAVEAAVKAENERCAKIVEDGGRVYKHSFIAKAINLNIRGSLAALSSPAKTGVSK